MEKHRLIKNIFRSIKWQWKDNVYQMVITGLLAAIITGSLFTGQSVRSSLRSRITESLGSTDILISSGLRYFEASLSGKVQKSTGSETVPILESDGFCQNFLTGNTVLNTKIYGVANEFFRLSGEDTVLIPPGTVALNEKLALKLGVKSGDEVIVHFRDTDPIPENAPFAPSGKGKGSSVFKVNTILSPSHGGNFSLGVSQITPMNVFVNLKDITGNKSGKIKANRLLIKKKTGLTLSDYSESLAGVLDPGDIGLHIRKSAKTKENEIISDRIFIDSAIVSEIMRLCPSAMPVLTYLANSINFRERSSPYFFISALPESMYGAIAPGNIVISKWLADDLDAGINDTVEIRWYDPASGNRLEEKEGTFVVCNISDPDSKYSDPLLMPDFPGISGSTTCSGWDAGVPILFDKIREKDEKYWTDYRGTPKAYIDYATGMELWGNNFGPATAIRFPADLDSSSIAGTLRGKLDPFKTGFSVTDMRKSNTEAANEGVDFSVLFLSLGIFIIISCIVLLSMALTLYFDSRKKQIRTYYALGFRSRTIRLILFSENALFSTAGAVAGSLAGYLLNVGLVKALNSVWTGAVQTNTITAEFSIMPLITGLFTCMLITSVLLYLKLNSFLRKLSPGMQTIIKSRSSRGILRILVVLTLTSIGLLIFSNISGVSSTVLSFTGGTFLFAAMMLALWFYYTSRTGTPRARKAKYSILFYKYHPSHAVTPALFMAAGIFAVVISGANQQVVNDRMLLPSGGTGGFLLWAESALPVKENLKSPEGRREFGFDEPEFTDLNFVQAKRVSGDDASCLNINHVTSPPLLGIDPSDFIRRGSFSFTRSLSSNVEVNPWSFLMRQPGNNTIYGIADQTVLEWGLKLGIGDTLRYRAENGQVLNIIICAGLRSSIFQGYLIIYSRNLERYFPSVSGSSVFLADGKKENEQGYIDALSGRLSGYGLSVEPAIDKLASFFAVTNTYIEVFMVLGILGLILGATGLGLVLIRNFNERKREFAIMHAVGFSARRIRLILLNDQLTILLWGILTGIIPGFAATWTTLGSGGGLSPGRIAIMSVFIFLIGIAALLLSARQVREHSLVQELRRE